MYYFALVFSSKFLAFSVSGKMNIINFSTFPASSNRTDVRKLTLNDYWVWVELNPVGETKLLLA